ncbi:MAG: hypothetical protein NTZ14_00130 [Hyphomicrobiales bacterium]|nr:hypothetical protein [Hyphomicrobiales bacterium]
MGTLQVIARARRPDGILSFGIPTKTVPSGDTESSIFNIGVDGSARLLTIWAGKDVEHVFGNDDHEQWLDFSPKAARELLGMLVWAQFGALDDPYKALKDFAEVSGITAETGQWT